MARGRCAGIAALAIGAPLAGPVRAEVVKVDASEVIASYRGIVDEFRRQRPRSAASRALVEEAAGWEPDVARLAATLAAMPPPSRDEVVRLGRETEARRDEPIVSESFGDERDLQADVESRGEDRERARYLPRRSGRRGDVPGDGRGADEAPRLEAKVRRGATGACLVEVDPRRCADLLKAAALLHTAVATLEQSRGDAVEAAQHRAIAGWLLWHLPRDAPDEEFVRDWLAAAVRVARGEGALASSRRLGRLALERFPEDPSLLLWTARAGEAMASLCFEEDGTPVTGGDCLELPVELEGSQPPALVPRLASLPDHRELVREVERDLEALARLAPDDAEVRLRLGRALARRGRAGEARRALEWVLAHATRSDLVALAHLLLGRLAEAEGDDASALRHADAALAAAPRAQAALMSAIAARLATGDREGAVALAADETRGTRPELWPGFLVGTPGSGGLLDALHSRVRLP